VLIDLPWMTLSLMPMEQEKSRRIQFSEDYGPTVVAATDGGELITISLFVIFRCATEDPPFVAYKAQKETKKGKKTKRNKRTKKIRKKKC